MVEPVSGAAAPGVPGPPATPGPPPAPDPVPEPPPHGPRITVRGLLEALASAGHLDRRIVPRLLGAARSRATVVDLDKALIAQRIINHRQLAEAKASQHPAGHPWVRGTPGVPHPERTLPEALVKSYGILATDRPEALILVEDTPTALQVAREHLGAVRELWFVGAVEFSELYRRVYTERTRVRTARPVADIWEVLDAAAETGASDIHLKVNQPPVLRVDGVLRRMERAELTVEWVETAIAELVDEHRFRRWVDNHDADFAVSYGTTRYRGNAGRDRAGPTLALRKLPDKIPDPDEIRLPRVVVQMAERERGLVLVTGPTGSGKSTTLASLLAHIIRTSPRHVITLEDPVEFLLPQGRGVVSQRELGEDFTSFAAGLRQALRQDPDVLLVGEMRDIETIRTAVTAAETGALVMSTLHTYDAQSTLNRLVGAFPADEQEQVRSQLAHILLGVVSQTLVPTANRGGRVAALEILVNSPAVAHNLREPEGVAQIRNIMEVSRREGMQTMEAALAALVRSGIVRADDAEFRARDLEAYRRALHS